MKLYYLIIALMFAFAGFYIYRHTTHENAPITTSGTLQYNFAVPTQTYKLPKRLKEISGLSLFDEQTIVGVQDEDGILFFYDLQTSKKTGKIKFGHDGDYEGVEKVGDDVYVLRSDGNLYRIRNLNEKEPNRKKIKTHLSTKNDTEGLAFDQKNNRLLVVCKEDPGKGMKGNKTRAVYAFDLTEKKLSKKPVFILDKETILNAINHTRGEFKPSGIAIHPISGDIYMIDSVGRILLVLSGTGEIKTVSALPTDLFPQPEGITFLHNGDLVIANEGGHGKGSLLRFNYK